jgi:RNA polymerase sigma-70 factor (ECF subfamily)
MGTLSSYKTIEQEKQFLMAYEQYGDAIFRHCYFRVSDREKAKDLVQEAFTRAWQFIANGQEVQNMKAYLYQIANNLIIDHYRKKKDISLDGLQDDGFDPGFDDREHLENFIAGKEAVGMLDQLDDAYRGVVIMRYIDDMPIQDIATIIGVSENVVSVRLHRALKKLRVLFNHEENIPTNNERGANDRVKRL